jgi:uncharacterized protein
LIAYFDTSAFVPLLVHEPASEACGRLWNAAERIVGVRLVYPEARAALAQANRMQRITTDQLAAAVDGLDELYGAMDRIDLTGHLAHAAGVLAQAHGLRGYDAVHLASAVVMNDHELVFVTGDHALGAAAAASGLTVAQTA